MKKEIDLEMIDKLCRMSQLKFSDEDKSALLTEVKSITKLLDNMSDVEEESDFLQTQKLGDLRVDEGKEGLDAGDVFLNAPNSHNDYFVVPKVVD